jgi:hypothetical protein
LEAKDEEGVFGEVFEGASTKMVFSPKYKDYESLDIVNYILPRLYYSYFS